jgi:7-carboxy-7-deazaguanine synthase
VGDKIEVLELVQRVEQFKGPYLLITGGEPLEQGEELLQFIEHVRRKGFHVTVETNGAYALPPRQFCNVDCYVVDYKLPGAKVGEVFRWENTNMFSRNDVVKFVISDEYDYEVAKKAYRRLGQRNSKARCAFSPVLDRLEPAALYYWMLEDNIWDVQLSLQLHKLVKLPEPR